MSPEYAHLDGRHWVNEAFVKAVQDLYPATTWKMPLGYRTYVGWTGKDEVWFVEHDAVDGIEGAVYEAVFEPDNPKAFTEEMLARVEHQTKHATVGDPFTQWRLERELLASYGETLEDARRRKGLPSLRENRGLYGYDPAIQDFCERSVRKLKKAVSLLARHAIRKDARVGAFLAEHARRGSRVARVLVQAYAQELPAVDSEKLASGKHWGMYGFPIEVANAGMKTCAELREAAGILGADMHRRLREGHENVTGFLAKHHKEAGCEASGMLVRSYPGPEWAFRMAMGPRPRTLEEWLAWDPPDLV